MSCFSKKAEKVRTEAVDTLKNLSLYFLPADLRGAVGVEVGTNYNTN